jgi:two-component system chemotaxis sensor kinase CheA
MIFEPGFSTAAELSTISGRGMGMSAVKDSIAALRGSLGVFSRKGEGTKFEMRFPLSLALVDGLLIQMEENFYIIPSDLVQECLALNPGEVDDSMLTASISWNGSVLPLLNLKRIMEMEGEALNVVVVRNRSGSSVGLICDRIVDTIQTVVKPLSALFKNETWLQGSSVLGSGEPVLILNVDGLIDSFRV